MSEIVERTPVELDAPIDMGVRQLENVLADAMEQFGLPSADVLVPFDERLRVLRNFGDAIADLDDERRARSMYLSKCMAAVAAGLF